MAKEVTETEVRFFEKKGPDGTVLTRAVSGVESEVSARFDGYFPPAGKSSAKTAAATS